MHPQTENGKTRARRKRHYPVNPPPQDADTAADQIIGDARKPYMLHALQVMNRRRSDGGFLFDDAEGHETFVCWRALGLKEKYWPTVAPWFLFMSKPEREVFDQRNADFALTFRNISAASRFSKVDRVRYGHEVRLVGGKTKRSMQALLQLPMIDADLEEVRRDERNATRRERWGEAHDAATAKCSDPREIAVVEAVFIISSPPRCWHDLSVPKIIRAIERGGSRSVFPRSHDTFRKTVRRVVKRLVKRGVLMADHRLVDASKTTEIFGTPSDASDSHTAMPTPPKPLKNNNIVGTPYRPWPKHRGTPLTTSLRGGEIKGLSEVEAGASTAPEQQAARHVDGPNASDTVGLAVAQPGDPVMGEPVESGSTTLNGATEQQERAMLTKEQWERARLEMEYLKQRVAELEKLLADDKQPDPTEPRRTLQ